MLANQRVRIFMSKRVLFVNLNRALPLAQINLNIQNLVAFSSCANQLQKLAGADEASEENGEQSGRLRPINS